MAFRWLRAYFERRDSKESYHWREPPAYTKRGRHVEWPEEYTTKRTYTEQGRNFWSRRGDGTWQGETVEQVRPRWITGWLGLGRGEPTEPPRREEPYEPWPGAGQSHGWVQDERPPYWPWPGEEGDDQRGGR